MSRMFSALLVLLMVLPCGCSGVRFIVDVVPSGNQLTETEVLTDAGASKNSTIAMIDVSGVIANASSRSILGGRENPVARLSESLRAAEKDDKVKAVILRINSPGGTVTASDMMYREVMDFREQSGKPVIVLMTDVAASGGYYLACAGDEIVAYPTTITGSIGVIMQLINVHDGLQRIGIHADAITSGPNKAAGSPLEPFSATQRELLQGIVNEMFANFHTVVTTSRPDIPTGVLSEVTDGRVVTGSRAAEVGLIDHVGDLRDAFEIAKQRAQLDLARLVKYHRPLEYVASPYGQSPATGGQTQFNLLQMNVGDDLFGGEGAGFYYLWDPTVW